ncbi:ubiquitin carboxyl-terminal hydrolase 5-like [Salvia miltiorrhiza]|uniref:ubiquitin carboxyl-terminal hydrolase 5-like n=1 Tax=Salvia miltiorrhiza TaxID=226208 RepID=UPI0025ACA89E|nr:ubiquitin carboxyl-terminal hydrolase 5-like [Salvia miltiorrhiza]
MREELALAFGELLRKLWSFGRTPIAPRVFKGKVARFAPQFSGYNHHDSQAKLQWLWERVVLENQLLGKIFVQLGNNIRLC